MLFTAWILVAIAINCVASWPIMGGQPRSLNHDPIGPINQTDGNQDSSFVVAPGEGGQPPDNWQVPYEPPMSDPYLYDQP